VAARPAILSTNDAASEGFYPRCGTASWIAGWTFVLKKRRQMRRVNLTARKLPGLRLAHARKLSLPNGWLTEFRAGSADDAKVKTAGVAVARVEHISKTKVCD
jgi:hypothetical protein